MKHRVFVMCFTAALVMGVHASNHAQDGRIFLPTDETIALWEFNFDLDEVGLPLNDGTVIPDLSGNGLNAVVEGNANGALAVGDGDFEFGDNTACEKVVGGSARVVVNDDRDSFEMGPDDSFTLELYVRRAEEPGTENWGYLAGTAHSRNLVDDTLDPIANGAWYGYGYIRHNEGNGWAWVHSPINADGSFNPSWNEPSSARFEIPAGSHYLVASVDREFDLTSIYLDGDKVGELGIPDGLALITPPGHDHARMMFLAAEDDASRGAYRPAPTGYAIDAARVQAIALSADEVLDNWLFLQDGDPIPPDATTPTAVITASGQRVLVNQCVVLSGESSTTPQGEITKYEWKVGDGDFEVGEVTREVSFPDPTGAGGIEVMLRVTNTADAVATASLSIVASHPAPVARIAPEVDGQPLPAGAVVLKTGDTLTLDGTTSSSPIPDDAFACPVADGNLVPAPAITEYRWDTNSDGTVDSTAPALDTGPWDTPGDSTITLTVVNEVGAEGTTTLDVTVRVPPIPGPPGRIFLPTEETIGLWEFNDLDFDIDEPLPDGTIIPDLSGNALDATVEANDGQSLVVGEGDPAFNDDDNTTCRKLVAGSARVVINDDDDAFEMGPDDDFTVELYVHRDEVPGTENWGYLAGTAHSRNLADDNLDPIADGAWYGYGYIRHNEGGGWAWMQSAINADGTFTPSWNEPTTSRFEIPAGSHYLVASVDRQIDQTRVYLDGVLVGSLGIPDGAAFITPPDHDHARFMFLAAEDDASRGAYRPAPTGYAIDAARIQRKALSAEEVLDNHQLIRIGFAVPPPSEPPFTPFHRGDPNDDGTINITDAIGILDFLFSGAGETPKCAESSDVNNDGSINITDAVGLLGFLFGGAGEVAPPGPATEPCGPDPDAPGSPGDLGCDSYTNC